MIMLSTRCYPCSCLFTVGVCLLFLSAGADRSWAEDGNAAKHEYFEKHVRPLLVEKCISCHGPEKQRGGLRLDSREAVLKGTDNGPGLVPNKPDESHLIRAIRYDGELKMPPQGKLSPEQIEILTKWVADGAEWPANPGKPGTTTSELPDWKQHWAFRPIARPALPTIKQQAWPRDPIDHFVLAKLEANGLTPSPVADPRALVRRLYRDLLGLPPTFEEVEAFAKDTRPEAYAELVNRLLDSPHFGERWARHWLDIARYADTKGYVFQEDRNYAQAFTYRDWVIGAFNRDLPYDQFLLRQIAADQLGEKDSPDLAAMGFLTLGRRFLNNNQDIIDDRIDVVMRGTMGLTVNCARCHDHKYDPIPSQDYYSLYGVFDSSNEPKDGAFPLRLEDKPDPHNVRVFIRGNAGNQGPEAPRRFLLVVAGENRPNFTKGSGRLEMAQAVVGPENPLTARVWVNRVWGFVMGRPLVDTPSDFGMRSTPPTHPEVIDELARTFIDEGWSHKKLLRRLLLSATYRQASFDRPEAIQKDPDNRFYWRMNRQRLDWEALRDHLLAATGELDKTLFGPSVQILTPPFPPRRSVYGFIDRQNLPGVLRTFDMASPDTHAPQRFSTTVPQQALYLLNSQFVMELLDRAETKPTWKRDAPPVEQVKQLYQAILVREPSSAELDLGVKFLSQSESGAAPLISSEWQYGYGEVNPESKRVTSFQPLPHWTGNAWQGGEKLPDDRMGWVFLNAQGGHPGEKGFAAIRRWVAPQAGTLTIRGQLKHPAAEGDGVLGRVVSSRTGQVKEWTAQHGNSGTGVNDLKVDEGEILDFVVEPRSSISHDSFEWKVRLELKGETAETSRTWNSEANFQGPTPKPLDLWERYAQVLLLTNEFIYID